GDREPVPQAATPGHSRGHSWRPHGPGNRSLPGRDPQGARALMEMAQPTWLPALVVLLASLAGGALFLWSARRKTGTPVTVDPAEEARQRRVERLMEQLRELETERHLMVPEAFAAERERLETEAAS